MMGNTLVDFLSEREMRRWNSRFLNHVLTPGLYLHRRETDTHLNITVSERKATECICLSFETKKKSCLQLIEANRLTIHKGKGIWFGWQEWYGPAGIIYGVIWTTFTTLFNLTLVKLLLLWLNYKGTFHVGMTWKLPYKKNLIEALTWQLFEPMKTWITDLPSMFTVKSMSISPQVFFSPRGLPTSNHPFARVDVWCETRSCWEQWVPSSSSIRPDSVPC